MKHISPKSLPRPPARSAPREISVLGALEWAFATENAELDFDDLGRDSARPGVSGIYVLMQRGVLGCQIDGGGRSRASHDAEVIANAVAALPDPLGGRGMAVQIAALARAGAVPDWRASPQPRCVPQGWRSTKHGLFAVTEKIGVVVTEYRGRRTTHDVVVCPVTYSDTAVEISQVRAAYQQWWDAVNWLRAWAITNSDMFDRLRITDNLPPRAPWRAMTQRAAVRKARCGMMGAV